MWIPTAGVSEMWLRMSPSRGQGSPRMWWPAVKHASSRYRMENNSVSGRLCVCVCVCVCVVWVCCRPCMQVIFSLLQSSRLVWWRMIEWCVQHQTSTTQGERVCVWVCGGRCVAVVGGRCVWGGVRGVGSMCRQSISSSLQSNESSHYY